MTRPIHASSYRVRRSRRRRHVAGYTLIEVMIAVSVMIVGAVSLLALQQATTTGNVFARQMTTANQVTRTWLERVRRDAFLWNQVGRNGLDAATGPVYLDRIAVGNAPNNWFTPVPTDVTESYASDYFGVDTRVQGNMVYCTHVRLSWVTPNESIRADVRTFWHRRGRGFREGIADLSLFPNCARGAEAGVTAELNAVPSRLHSVTASVVVRWSPVN